MFSIFIEKLMYLVYILFMCIGYSMNLKIIIFFIINRNKESVNEELSWLRCLLILILLWEKHRLVVSIHCDSNAAIAKIKNYCYNGKRRQVRRKQIIVWDCISKEWIMYALMELNRCLTKGLVREKVHNTLHYSCFIC